MSLIEWIEIPDLGDHRGSLVVFESNKNIPFDLKRLYYIFDVKSDAPRGFHAHKKLKQIAFCIKGKCKMLMDNGLEKQEVWIDQSNKGLLIPPMVWHEMHDFSDDCIMLVVASDYYDESDYIREYEKFKNYSKLTLVEYDQDFLEKSWDWLNDEELKYLTMTPDFTKEQQEDFYKSLSSRKDYFIYGVSFLRDSIGACGLKNIIDNKAELWLYIGNKKYWGKGLGKKIMFFLEDEAVQKGLDKLYLKVLKENKIAINLYTKLNYINVEEHDKYIVMEKTL
jgi:RimJ/RimL family protein N-acetyltransferase